MFQSCCVGNSSEVSFVESGNHYSYSVSILAVLEIVLEDFLYQHIQRFATSFNPCCVGNSSEVESIYLIR